MHYYLKDINNGDTVSGTYLIKSAQQALTSRGEAFWNLILADSSTQLNCKIWSPLASQIKEIPTAKFASIEAKAQIYKEAVQLTLNEFRLLEEEEQTALDLSLYLNTSERPIEEMQAELESIIKKHFTHKAWKKFLKAAFADPRIAPYLPTAPGAKSVHHAYVGGLLEHSLSVTNICIKMTELYPNLDKQCLLAAALLHDIGKIEELSGALSTEYTNQGKLLGHIILGLNILEKHFQKSDLEPYLVLHFKHLLLSHHGELEYGSPKVPATAEAFVLHYADNMDAKIMQCKTMVPEKSDDEGMAWSPWNNLLARQICKPLATPQNLPVKNEENKENGKNEETEEKRKLTLAIKDMQCSLL